MNQEARRSAVSGESANLLAEQLKSILTCIARYVQLIAQLFGSHSDSFDFRDVPGAGLERAATFVSAIIREPE